MGLRSTASTTCPAGHCRAAGCALTQAPTAVQRRGVHGRPHPPDAGQVRDGTAEPQPGAQLRACFGGPPGDRRIRPCAGQGRAHGHGQDSGRL
jgi:hypothetical protein